MSDDTVKIGEHEYPSRHPKGSGGWAFDAAWAILDLIKPGIIPDDVRAFLAGSFAARLERERKQLDKLQDPVVVHANMLRGTIAKPSLENIRHLYPELDQAEQVCAEAYQVVASLLSDLGLFDSERGQKIMDNLSEARMVHPDVLPWPDKVTTSRPDEDDAF